VVRPSHRREMAQRAHNDFGVSIRASCGAFGISETGYRYQAKLSTENEKIADWLLRLSIAHKRWGFGLCFIPLQHQRLWLEPQARLSHL